MSMMRHNIDHPLPLEDGSVQCVITSPPYWGLRRYGASDDELGIEDLLRYVRRLTLGFRNVRRSLADDGVMWVNIGDTSAGSGGAGGDHSNGSKQQIAKYRQGRPLSLFPYHEANLLTGGEAKWTVGPGELVNGQLCLVPSLLAWHLQGDGWIVRKWIVWDKGREKPENLNHVRRPRSSHEVILMVTKSMRYKFHVEHLTETGDVWHFAPGATRKAVKDRVASTLPAPFPNELVMRCMMPSTDHGDTVLDPFAGSGVVPTVAQMNGRVGIGFDLYAPELEADAG